MLFSDDAFSGLDDFFARGLFPAQKPSATLPMDAWRDEEALHLTFEVPGVRDEDVSLEVDRSVLTITVDKAVPEVAGDRIRSERLYGRSTRRLGLGEALDLESVEAALTQGVLKLRIPIAERAKPRRIEIGRVPERELESSDA